MLLTLGDIQTTYGSFSLNILIFEVSQVLYRGPRMIYY